MKNLIALTILLVILTSCTSSVTKKTQVIADEMTEKIMDSIMTSAIYPNKWEDQNIVDDFGDVERTVKSFTTLGEFSNSATRNSDLKVVVTEFDDLYRISLYEYGSGSPESLSYEWEKKLMTVKLEDGSKVSGTVTYVPEGQGVYIYKKNKLGRLITSTKGKIKFGIVEGSTSYRFTINGIGKSLEKYEKRLKEKSRIAKAKRDKKNKALKDKQKKFIDMVLEGVLEYNLYDDAKFFKISDRQADEIAITLSNRYSYSVKKVVRVKFKLHHNDKDFVTPILIFEDGTQKEQNPEIR